MTSDVWLQRYGIECERYSLRLSPAACARYREERPERCKGCLVEPVAEPLAKRIRRKATVSFISQKRKEEPPMAVDKPKRGCSIPGCDDRHEARGFCKTHYMEDYKRRKAGQSAGGVPAAKIDPPPAVLKPKKDKVDNSIGKLTFAIFERDRGLYERLKAAAEDNRRTLAAEVLFRLERSFEDVG